MVLHSHTYINVGNIFKKRNEKMVIFDFYVFHTVRTWTSYYMTCTVVLVQY
jgi:hypothetical protein